MVELYDALMQLFGNPEWWVWQMLIVLAAAIVPVKVIWLGLQAVAGLSTYIERKVAADIQRRVGPNQCQPSNFLGAVISEAVERAKKENVSAGHKLAAKVLGPLTPVFKLLDRTVGVAAPGMLIFLADGIKLIMKEEIIPSAADKPLFKAAPVIVLCSAFAAAAALPYSSRYMVADFNIGVFYILAITSIEAIGVLMAGWASNNKWALLGGMRSAAQIVSYEIPIGIAILTGVVLCGTFSMQGMVYHQVVGAGVGQGWWWNWNVFANPFMFMLFPLYYLAGLAECNRTPFDIPEAESELVAGYHTEYTGMRFAFFFMGEYAMMCVVSAIAVTIFLGGWSTGIGLLEHPVNGLFVAEAATYDAAGTLLQAPLYHWWASLVHLLAFVGKTYALVFIMMWVRWTLPRFRVDQMMTLCWKKLIPIAMFAFTGVCTLALLRPWYLAPQGSTTWNVATTWISAFFSFGMIVFMIWWFGFKKLTPEQQVERKLIAETNLRTSTGGMA